jgi:hypothetical protein
MRQISDATARARIGGAVQGWTRRWPIYSLFMKILAKIFFFL